MIWESIVGHKIIVKKQFVIPEEFNSLIYFNNNLKINQSDLLPNQLTEPTYYGIVLNGNTDASQDIQVINTLNLNAGTCFSLFQAKNFLSRYSTRVISMCYSKYYQNKETKKHTFPIFSLEILDLIQLKEYLLSTTNH